MKSIPVFRSLSDAELAAEVERLAARERDSTVAIIASLEEFDRRQLFFPAGYRSLFMYCREHLRMGEGAAYTRIEAARAYRRFPVVLSRLADGSVTLSTIGLIARHLTPANHIPLLDRCRHQPKREVERIVAGLHPKPDAPTIIRRAAEPSLALATCEVALQPSPRSVVPARPVLAPLTYERFKLQITIDSETHDMLREVQDLIRHAVPSADPAVIFTRALRLLRDDLLRRKAAQVAKRRLVKEGDRSARHARPIPADVRRVVWARDGGQCAFVGSHGRCSERAFLEYHHLVPFAAGGVTSAENIELRCQGHNNFEARLYFGSENATAG